MISWFDGVPKSWAKVGTPVSDNHRKRAENSDVAGYSRASVVSAATVKPRGRLVGVRDRAATAHPIATTATAIVAAPQIDEELARQSLLVAVSATAAITTASTPMPVVVVTRQRSARNNATVATTQRVAAW